LKTATWLDTLLRHQHRLAELKPRVLVLQFGGAAGSLASLGERGMEVAAALGTELHLQLPDIPWHTSRDRIAEVATFHGLLTGTLGKIARDMALLMQTEVAELAEPSAPGRGGSSTMPHKQNPVAAAAILAAATRVPGLVSTMLSAMVQEHERGLGGWHAEWESLPEICTLTLGALEKWQPSSRGCRCFPKPCTSTSIARMVLSLPKPSVWNWQNSPEKTPLIRSSSRHRAGRLSSRKHCATSFSLTKN
jgi:3-carboxy-cis,cis-muconate cycloisomerase